MNENSPNNKLSDVPWPTSTHRMRVPDTSMLPGSEQAALAVGVVMSRILRPGRCRPAVRDAWNRVHGTA